MRANQRLSDDKRQYFRHEWQVTVPLHECPACKERHVSIFRYRGEDDPLPLAYCGTKLIAMQFKAVGR